MTLRRLRIVGIVLPLLFVLALELIRLTLIEHGPTDYGPHVVLAMLTVLAIVAFSFVMFRLIARAQAETAQVVSDLRRRQREGHAFYDVLLRISNQEPLAEILATVAHHCGELLAGDQAAVCLNEHTARSVQLRYAPGETAPLPQGVCIAPDAHGPCSTHELRQLRPSRSSARLTESLRVPVQSSDRTFGEIWVGRSLGVPFEERDRDFLSTCAGFASIAVTSARVRESERQAAILAERERLARELHDSLAQVLGAVHLRLRALAEREGALAPRVALELIELADVCAEGYSDVRGAILELHESSRTGRNLLDSLCAYLEKYSRQCGIAASLNAAVEQDLALPPRSEVQIIRVVQEALANVRKHSGAAAATVHVARGNGTVAFVIEDDGCGFEVTEELLERGGFGLRSMRERMEMIGGTLRTDSAYGRGTRVVAELPSAPVPASIPSSISSS